MTRDKGEARSEAPKPERDQPAAGQGEDPSAAAEPPAPVDFELAHDRAS